MYEHHAQILKSLFLSPQSGTHSASLDKQRQLQSAAQSFYQQVVHVLKHRVSAEKENPGLCCEMFHNSKPAFTLGALFLTEMGIKKIASPRPRFKPAPPPCHNVCTEFLLPAGRPGAGH